MHYKKKEDDNLANLGIPQNTIAILQKYDFNFQKKFGQNFLIDTHVLEKIMDSPSLFVSSKKHSISHNLVHFCSFTAK